MNLSDYRESLSLHEKGAPIAVGSATFYVRRLGTSKANKKIKELKLALWGPFSAHDEQDANELFAHLLTEWLVTGWEGVSGEDNEPLAYSQASARKVFLNPEYWLSLNTILINAANYYENFLHEQAEEDTEALKKP